MDNCIFTPEKLPLLNVNWMNVGTECWTQYLNAWWIPHFSLCRLVQTSHLLWNVQILDPGAHGTFVCILKEHKSILSEGPLSRYLYSWVLCSTDGFTGHSTCVCVKDGGDHNCPTGVRYRKITREIESVQWHLGCGFCNINRTRLR